VYPLPPSEWTTSRTDQGVDFVNKSAGSRILAIGRAKIVSTGAPGWPAGGGVLYELLDGPRKGQLVYNFENVKPHVRPGQEVQAGQVIATMKGTGYPWLEMGFAKRSGEPTSHGEYSGANETKGGKAFKAFLGTLKKGGGGGLGEGPGRHGGYTGNFSPAVEKKAQEEAQKENLGEGFFPTGGEISSEILSGIFGEIHPEALMLNIALVGGGAFLTYYGAALVLGVKKPVASPVKAVTP
jgi:murein DD-endopeptidase MepM/ murein hydrolase activator NlpD